MHAKRNSHLDHIREMVELARDTKASAHSPWGAYATAWVLGWATNTAPYYANTPPQSCSRWQTRTKLGRSWVEGEKGGEGGGGGGDGRGGGEEEGSPEWRLCD